MKKVKPLFLYNGNITPYAVVFWYKPGEDEPSYRTVCYDQKELLDAVKRQKMPGDFYYGMKYRVENYNPEPNLLSAA